MPDRQECGDDILVLLSAAQGDDGRALEVLVSRTRPVVLDFLTRRFASSSLRDLYEDVTHETLIRVMGHLKSCRAGSPGEYWSWVLTIARREALRVLKDHDARRRATVPQSIIENLAATPAAGKAGFGSFMAILQALRPLVEALAPDQQELIYLRLVEGRSWAEVGDALGTSAAGAKRRLQRLQARLARDLLEQAGDRTIGSPPIATALRRLEQALR